VDLSGAVLSTTHLSFGRDKDVVFCVEANFHFEEAGADLRGHFILLPDVASLNSIFDAIRI
jgi:hypothetical protein